MTSVDMERESLSQLARAIQARLVGRLIGRTYVRSTSVHLGAGSEPDDSLVVEVVLSDPSGDTWPLDDVRAIYRVVSEVVVETAGGNQPVYIRVSPETETPQDGEEGQLPL